MTRLEASAFPLACGSACVFVLAVALHRLPWEAAFAVIALAVSAWAWRSPLIVGVVVGGIAWLCVTGFDVHRLGDIRVTGIDDAARAAVLVLAGVLTAAAHALAGARHGPRRTDPVWTAFYETGLERSETSGDVVDRLGYQVPCEDGAVRVERSFPVHPVEEPRNG